MEEVIENIKSILVHDPVSPMLFNTGLFLVLFVLFFAVYYLVKNRPVLKMLLVITFSLYFYYKSSGWACAILACVCVSDYLLGRWMEYAVSMFQARLIVLLNVAVNVGMLVYFKYFNLLGQAFTSITGTGFDPLDIMLPAGISFFTFRSISYIIDVYRGDMKPCHSLLQYAFFLTFFPPLLAGPVVRARDMLPQIEANSNPTPQMTSEGLFLIMSGLVKKVVIADYISGNFVDRIFDNPALYSGFENLMGCVGFTIQIYCDFSGYSDMAIGLALMLGYRFKDNFMAPFKACNPQDFWRRWHISLSTWLRDYIYIPLGGNRRGKFRTYLNNILTMLIGGLWHGASWMYVLWGAYHGVLLAIHKAFKGVWRLPAQFAGRKEIRYVNIAVMFVLTVIGFAIFRAPDLATLTAMATQITGSFHLSVATQFVGGYMMIVAAMLLGYMMHIAPARWTAGSRTAYMSMPLIWQSVILALVLFVIIQVRQSDLVPFIYLQY